jgi:hypothetical protein
MECAQGTRIESQRHLMKPATLVVRRSNVSQVMSNRLLLLVLALRVPKSPKKNKVPKTAQTTEREKPSISKAYQRKMQGRKVHRNAVEQFVCYVLLAHIMIPEEDSTKLVLGAPGLRRRSGGQQCESSYGCADKALCRPSEHNTQLN